MRPGYSKHLVVAILAILVVQCGGSKAPTTPSTTNAAKGTLVVNDVSVTGARTNTGFSYTIRITVQNTGNAVANISDTTLTFAAGGARFASVPSVREPFSTTAVNPGASLGSRTINVTDDNAGDPYADTMTVTVVYAGGAGSENATKSVAVPTLPTPAPPSTPTTVTLAGTVTEVGGGPISAMNIEIRDGPDAKKFALSDALGRYTLPGLQPGTITVRAWKSGYTDTDQRVTLSGSTITLNLAVPRSSTPSPSPPPSCCKVCTTGKPCGDTCISKDDTCHVGPGCACSSAGLDALNSESLNYTPVPLPMRRR